MSLSFIRSITLWVFIGVLMSSCAIKAPTFQSMSELKVTTFTKKEITVKGEIIFNNPNKNRLNLNDIKLQMSSNKNLLGSFYQELNSPIEPFSNFTVPFAITFDPVQLGQNLISTAISAFSKSKIKVAFKGYIKVSGQKNKGGIKIPIIYSKSLKF